MLGGIFILMICSFLSGVTQNFWELVLYRFLQGIGSAMWQTMRQTMLQDILKPKERGRDMGYFLAFTMIGSSAEPSIGGVLADNWGIRAPFFGYSPGGFVCFILSFFLISESTNVFQNSTKSYKGSEFSWAVIKTSPQYGFHRSMFYYLGECSTATRHKRNSNPVVW